MPHLDAMSARLPRLYRDGELLRSVLGVAALQLDALEEEALEVQRSHWFDATFELAEAADLAALLDIAPESWQELRDYRAWVHALRSARLAHGAVTPQAIHEFVRSYGSEYQRIAGMRAVVEPPAWRAEPGSPTPLVENPPLRRVARVPAVGGLEPLQRFELENRGIDPGALGCLMTGLPAAPEFVPALVNLTTSEALVFRGSVPPGARLWLRSTTGGEAEATLEGRELSDRLVYVTAVQPGTPWEVAQIGSPARALTLLPGKNELWFLPIAHYDDAGLDRFLLALAGLDLRQGRFDESEFDHALFLQQPAVRMITSWVEAQPARFEVHLDAAALVSSAPGEDGGDPLAEAVAAREELASALDAGVQRLRPAGVEAAVRLAAAAEIQGQMDRLTAVLPQTHREAGATGADRLPEAGGVFEVTEFDDSTFR